MGSGGPKGQDAWNGILGPPLAFHVWCMCIYIFGFDGSAALCGLSLLQEQALFSVSCVLLLGDSSGKKWKQVSAQG